MSHRDRIEILGLELLLYCGVLPEEKIRRQPFRVDLELELDLSAPAQTDDLDATVDYGKVIDLVATRLEAERFDLLERAAGLIAELVLADESVSAVEVAVHKLRPPVPHHVQSTGVRLRRERT